MGAADKATIALGYRDLCLPSELNDLSRKTKYWLFRSGTPLWHSLVKYLSPDFIIISIARRHLGRIDFPRVVSAEVVYTIDRPNPYNVELTKIRIEDSRPSYLVF